MTYFQALATSWEMDRERSLPYRVIGLFFVTLGAWVARLDRWASKP